MKDSLMIILLIALITLPKTNSIKKCPIECTCDLDANGRYSAICEKGKTSDDGGNCLLIFASKYQLNSTFFSFLFIAQKQEI